MNLSAGMDKFKLESKNEINFGSCSRQGENGPFAGEDNKLKCRSNCPINPLICCDENWRSKSQILNLLIAMFSL